VPDVEKVLIPFGKHPNGSTGAFEYEALTYAAGKGHKWPCLSSNVFFGDFVIHLKSGEYVSFGRRPNGPAESKWI
jgi:hypothetical protein